MPDYTPILANFHRLLPSLRAAQRITVAVVLAISAALLASGCVYKTQIRQGDTVLPKNINLLKAGMTRDEVIEMLGNHAIPQVYAGNNWVYYYSERPSGFTPQPYAVGVELVFRGDIVSEVIPLKPDNDWPANYSPLLPAAWLKQAVDEMEFDETDPDVEPPEDGG